MSGSILLKSLNIICYLEYNKLGVAITFVQFFTKHRFHSQTIYFLRFIKFCFQNTQYSKQFLHRIDLLCAYSNIKIKLDVKWSLLTKIYVKWVV